MRIAVLGAGAWGTALAIAFARHEAHNVVLWGRSAQMNEMAVVRENRRYLPNALFPDALRVTDSWSEACADRDLIVIVTPIAGLRATVERLSAEQIDVPFLWACKGFEAGTGLLAHQVVQSVWPDVVRCGALSGPSFAQEVAADLPAALTVAAADQAWLDALVHELHIPRLRLYATTDIVGVEVGGAVKNVMAIAAGVADGLQFGLNARAALLTRGLAEMARLAERLGGRPDTLLGLSGVGDLILTCTGDLSRNRRVGQLLAAGRSLSDILATLGHVAEGVSTAKETLNLARHYAVEMPITECVEGLLSGRFTVEEAVHYVLDREPRGAEVS